MNRIDRISAILIHLQSKQIVKASELAKRFEVSKRTIYRDIRSLEEAGVPLGGEAGVGYFLSDNYHLPPISLTREEAGSFIVAAKLMEKHSDFSINQQFQSGLTKIRSVLRNTDKDYLANIEDQIEVLNTSNRGDSCTSNPFFALAMQAMNEGKVLEIEYISGYTNEETRREVEPYNLWFYSMNWHLIGYCRKRKGYRDFRMDRIKSVTITGHRFEKPAHFSIEHYYAEMMKNQELFSAQLLVDEEIYSHIQNSRYYFGFLNEERIGNQYKMNFLVNDLQYLSKWIITLGNHVQIINNKPLKDLILNELEILSKHYQKKSKSC